MENVERDSRFLAMQRCFHLRFALHFCCIRNPIERKVLEFCRFSPLHSSVALMFWAAIYFFFFSFRDQSFNTASTMAT